MRFRRNDANVEVFLDGHATIHDKMFDCRSNDGQPIREADFFTCSIAAVSDPHAVDHVYSLPEFAGRALFSRIGPCVACSVICFSERVRLLFRVMP